MTTKNASAVSAAEQELKALEVQVGDPDAISDEHGDLPATRRGYNRPQRGLDQS